MNCAGCRQVMTSETFAGHLGRPVPIDYCLACQVFWFDRYESLQLAPAATLRLFQLIGGQSKGNRPAPVSNPSCPRCGAQLALAHDRQGSTPFQYWRCERGDGRLITFFNFLREKSFIRSLSADQVAQLRENLGAVNCSNCGAPVDLSHGETCEHCGSPLSMLDIEQTRRLIAQLQAAGRTERPVDPALPLALEHARTQVETTFAPFEHHQDWLKDVSDLGLVGAGISAVLRWLGESSA